MKVRIENGGIMSVAILILLMAVVIQGVTTYQFRVHTVREGKPDTVTYGQGHVVTVVSFDNRSAEYSIHSDPGVAKVEQIAYDGGFLGYVTLGLLGGAGRYEIDGGGRVFRVSCMPEVRPDCHSGYKVAELPPNFQTMRAIGRRLILVLPKF